MCMQINNYPKYIFWNYADDADLPENIVAEQVLSYGDIEDISLAFKQIS